MPPGQKDPYERDLKQCYIDNRIGIDPAPPITHELAEREYAAQIKVYECLTALGRQVPQMPSFQVFESKLMTSGDIISVYGLASDAGTNLRADSVAWSSCPDPLDTWGHN